MNTWKLILSDIERYADGPNLNIFSTLRLVLTNESMFCVILFRLSHRISLVENYILRLVLKVVFLWTIYRLFYVLLGIEIDLEAEIGMGFYIGHYGGIQIGPVEIGHHCNISQQVTIGYGRLGSKRYGVPKIGNYVYIGPGAKIFGKIEIGDNVSIGANAVVSKDIPENAIVVGNPGRIVGYQESNPYIQNVFD